MWALVATLLGPSGSAQWAPPLPVVEVSGADEETRAVVAEAARSAVAGFSADFVNRELRISIQIQSPQPGTCPARAWASFVREQGLITVYLDDAWPLSTLQRVVAHEVGHVYHQSLLGPLVDGPRGDAILNEGLATWLAGRIWLRDIGYATFAEAVLANRARGDYFELEGELPDVMSLAFTRAECFALRDVLYTQWGAFVGHLVSRFGIQAVLDASNVELDILDDGAGRRILAPLEYEDAFGATLAELEADWLSSLYAPD